MTADHDGRLSCAPAMVVSAISFLAVAGCLALLIVDQVARPVHPTPDITPRIALPVLGLAFAIVGGALSARKQLATIGWLFTVVSLGLALGALLFEYGTRAIYVSSGELPAGDVGIWVGDWLPFVMIPAISIPLLLFPTGRLLSARWRLPMTAAIVLAPLFLLQDMFISEVGARACLCGSIPVPSGVPA